MEAKGIRCEEGQNDDIVAGLARGDHQTDPLYAPQPFSYLYLIDYAELLLLLPGALQSNAKKAADGWSQVRHLGERYDSGIRAYRLAKVSLMRSKDHHVFPPTKFL